MDNKVGIVSSIIELHKWCDLLEKSGDGLAANSIRVIAKRLTDAANVLCEENNMPAENPRREIVAAWADDAGVITGICNDGTLLRRRPTGWEPIYPVNTVPQGQL